MSDIKGYRTLTPAEIQLVNESKDLGETVGEFIMRLKGMPGVDQRWVAIAQDQMQLGLMALVRAVAQPDNF
jgi:hypothetical protein